MISDRWLLALAVGAGLATPAAAEPKAAFVARCAMCHQAGGEGLSGQFPRLATRAAVIADLKRHPGIAGAVWSPR